METEYTGWNTPMNVTLTATSNPYLAGRLPLRGLLQVLEASVDGYAMARKVTFQELDTKGHPVGATVAADDAEFTYSLRTQAASH